MSDGHERFQRRIDELLVAGASIEEERSLSAHLRSCGVCQRYLEASRRAVAGLAGFSFVVGPTLNAKVAASLRVRAQELEAARLRGRQLAVVCAVAVVLTVTGSLLELQCGGLVASLLDVTSLQVRRGLIEAWIIPSICLLLLFPILPLLSAGGANRSERNLW